MNTTAYLVVHLDITKSPPVPVCAGIYSAPAQGLTGAHSQTQCSVEVARQSGYNFEDAIGNLKRWILDPIYGAPFKWAVALLPEHERIL